MLHRFRLAGRLVAASIVLAVVNPTFDPSGEWREEVVPARRGTVRDHGGRIVAIDGPLGREYPYESLAAHAIGYVAMGPSGDVIGRSGIEDAWDGSLRGRHGVRRVALDAHGQPTGSVTRIAGATPGRDVTLTLDMDLMEIVRGEFADGEAGAVVVVDVADGAVRALFSAPSFDPGQLSAPLSTETLEALRAIDALADRATERTQAPGGTMKPLTVLAGLEAGMDPTSVVQCSGNYVFGRRSATCTGFHGEMDARHAIATSCSVYPYSVVTQVGLEGLAAVARDFGLGSETGLGLRGEAPGHMPTAETGAVDEVSAAAAGLLASIGQGDVQVTPLQLAMAYAAIANGGTLWQPRIVSSLSTPEGALIEEIGARAQHRLSASPEHLAYISEALDAAVNEWEGTAYRVRSRRIRVAGKTGHGHLAGTRRGVVATWFAGFAPVNDPQIAIVVLVEGSHDDLSASIAMRVLERTLDPS